MDFFYDAQMTRYLEQIVRAFSGFSYQAGGRNGQPGQINLVPCRMATTNRMVANIMRNLSENTLLSVPMITIAHEGIAGRRSDLQNPSHVSTLQVVERAIDENGQYTADRGNSYTVFRLMPLPFEMTLKVDIWTSNQLQKYQLFEQIALCIYPSFDIQNSENAVDWGAKTLVTVEDFNWSSRSIPIGTSNEIDVMSLTLKLPIWLTPPAKIQQQTIIREVITNFSGTPLLSGEVADPGSAAADPTFGRMIITPEDAHLQVNVADGTLKLERADGGTDVNWMDFLNMYGLFRPALSRISVVNGSDPEATGVGGTLQLDQNDPTLMHWQIDPETLPSNTLTAVTAAIDPRRSFPGNQLPLAQEGVRYLLLNDIGPSQAWPNLTASADDIIQYTNGQWVVAFDASATSQEQYVLNSYTGSQLHWTGTDWYLAINQIYEPGFWKIAL